MHRRCKFLDECPAFNYNMGLVEPGAEDTSHLGSTLMSAMLGEVAEFCTPEIQKNWSCKPHQQVTLLEHLLVIYRDIDVLYHPLNLIQR